MTEVLESESPTQTEEPQITVEKPKRTKKERSPAQQEAFAKCIEMRKKRAEEQLALKEKKQEIINGEVEEHIQKVKRTKKPKKKVIVQESSSDDEPEVIYIKKPKKKKKTKKRVIVEQSSSESEEENVSVEKPQKPRKEVPVVQEKQEESNQPEYINKLLLMRTLGF